jgi:hypothetical protein
VQSADCDKGIVRIPISVRGDTIERGQWYEVSVAGRSTVVRVFGTSKDGNVIQMDLTLRKRLDVNVGKPYNFRVRPVGPFKEVWYGWRLHPDVGIRVSTALGLWGLLLAGVGLVLGVASIYLTVCQ